MTVIPQIFVFGSNLAGRHGAGAAKFAVENYGAKYGQGVGLQGSSYGIPTKDFNVITLPLSKIKPYVEEFIEFAKTHPELKFNVTKIGCGLAGYKVTDIAPMFVEALEVKNIILNPEFETCAKTTRYFLSQSQ